MTMLKKPKFWAKSTHLKDRMLRALLWPFSLLYILGFRLNQILTKPYKPHAETFIICIGNITAGGAGKTPTVMAIYDAFAQQDTLPNTKNNAAAAPPSKDKIAIIMKGYTGQNVHNEAFFVDAHTHTAGDVGDEAFMLAQRKYPVIVCKSRKNAVKYAQSQGYTVLIMDDGMQNPSIIPNIRLCVIDGEYGFGNAHCLPAGPLRAPLQTSIDSIDGFIIIGEDKSDIQQKYLSQSLAVNSSIAASSPISQSSLIAPCFSAEFKLEPFDLTCPYFAFAGIGNPDKFYASLTTQGANIVGTQNFPDHHKYSAQDIAILNQKAAKCGATLITTEKDIVKINAPAIACAKGTLHIKDIDVLMNKIIRASHV